jgi:4'-phosphopantetheinyl transferase
MTSRVAEPHTAELWLVDLSTAGAALEAMEAATPRLAAVDEARFGAMSDVPSRHDRRLSHIALRLCLERATGSTACRQQAFALSPSGKPSLPDSPTRFSLSHTRGVALVAVAHGVEIGVDIERSRPIRVMGERRAAIERAGVDLAGGRPLPDEGEARFLTAWVRLEAFAKAEGSGVGAHLSVIMGRRPKPSTKRGPLARGPGPLQVRDLALGRGLFAAVALPEAVRTPVPARFPDEQAGLERLLR